MGISSTLQESLIKYVSYAVLVIGTALITKEVLDKLDA